MAIHVQSLQIYHSHEVVFKNRFFVCFQLFKRSWQKGVKLLDGAEQRTKIHQVLNFFKFDGLDHLSIGSQLYCFEIGQLRETHLSQLVLADIKFLQFRHLFNRYLTLNILPHIDMLQIFIFIHVHMRKLIAYQLQPLQIR